MNRSNAEQQLEHELKQVGRTPAPVSPLVRSRLEATYASLPAATATNNRSTAAATVHGRSATAGGEIETPKAGRRPGTALRKAAAVAASVVVLSAGLFASGFVSPAMADTIRDIPVIGSLFSQMENDTGLRTAGERHQGSLVDAAATSGSARLNVRETIFDGTRIAFAVELTVPGIQSASKLEENMQTVHVKLDGIGELDGVFYDTPEPQGGDTYGVLMNLPLNADQIRQLGTRFDGKISISIAGQPQPLSVTVPFERIDGGRELHLNPGPSASDDRYALSIDALDVTASTVQLRTSLSLRDRSASAAKREAALLRSAYDIVDDRGQTLDVVGGEGSLVDGKMTYTSNYGADLSRAKFIVVKPYIRGTGAGGAANKTDQTKVYLEELELKIDLELLK